MTTYTLDLGNALVTTGTGVFVKGSTAPKITDGVTPVTGVFSDDLKTITFAGFGTVTASAATPPVVTFTADSAAAAGTYAFSASNGTPTKLDLPPAVTVVNAAAMTNAMTITNDAAITKITGGSAADTFTGNTAATYIDGGAGADTITSSVVNATLIGGAGNDSITGSYTADGSAVNVTANLNGGAGDDTIKITSTTTTADKDVTIANAVVGGAGNDTISVSNTATTAGKLIVKNIYGNEGDDTIEVGAATDATVSGGTGADAFVQKAATATVKVSDYKYSDKDTIKLATVFADDNGQLSNTGVYTATGVTTDTVELTNGVFKVVATDSSAATKDFWTAQTTALSGSDSASLDLSAVSNVYVVDTQGVKTASVTVASNAAKGGQVTFNAADDSANSLTVSKAGGIVKAVNFTANDVLNLSGTASLSYAGTDDTDYVVSNGTSVSGVLHNATADIITYTENGSTTKKTLGVVGKVVTSNKVGTTAITLTTATGTLDKYVSKSDKTGIGMIDASALTTAQSFRLNNDTEADKYTNIYYVKGGAAGGTFVGANDGVAATTFDLSTATVGSQIWAGGTKNALTLALHDDSTDKKAAADTIWMGTTEQTNTVTKFSKGFADTSDIIYLYETADVNNADLYTGVTGGNAVAVKAGKTATGTVALSDVNVLAASGVQLKVKDASGTVRNVAYGSTDATGIQAVDQTAGTTVADYVIGKAASTEVDYTSTVTGQSYNVRLNNDDLATTKFTSVSKVKMDVADDAKATVVGSNSTVVGANAFTLDGAQTDFWGGGSQKDTVQLSTVKKAANTVWYGKTDGLDVVANTNGDGTQTNTVYFYDEASLATLMKDYKAAVDIDNTQVTFTYDAKNMLTLDDTAVVSSFYVKTQAGSTKAAAATATGATSLTFASDTALYIGNGAAVTAVGSAYTTLNVSGTAGATVRLANDDGTNYYQGIAAVDASKVTAGNVVLVGSGESSVGGSMLTGGYGTQNDFWGGSKATDTFVGQNGITDVAWFDSGDGADTATTFGKEDKVYLYNTSSIDTVKVSASDNNLVITVSDGDTMTLKNGALSGSTIYGSDGITVGLNNGSNYYVNKATDGTYSLVKKA